LRSCSCGWSDFPCTRASSPCTIESDRFVGQPPLPTMLRVFHTALNSLHRMHVQAWPAEMLLPPDPAEVLDMNEASPPPPPPLLRRKSSEKPADVMESPDIAQGNGNVPGDVPSLQSHMQPASVVAAAAAATISAAAATISAAAAASAALANAETSTVLCPVCKEEFDTSAQKQELVQFCAQEHMLCRACAAGTVSAAVGAGQVPLRCCWEPEKRPASAAPNAELRCTEMVHPAAVSLLVASGDLAENVLPRFEKLILLAALPPHLRMHCPHAGCGALLALGPDPANAADHETVLLQACPYCSAPVCVVCQSPPHDGRSCAEQQALMAERGKMEAATQALVAATAKPCPQCPPESAVLLTHYRGHGCHHLTHYTPDGDEHHMCYLCGEIYDPNEEHGCELFCPEDCSCPVCPDCKPEEPCADCGCEYNCPGCFPPEPQQEQQEPQPVQEQQLQQQQPQQPQQQQVALAQREQPQEQSPPVQAAPAVLAAAAAAEAEPAAAAANLPEQLAQPQQDPTAPAVQPAQGQQLWMLPD